MKYYMVSVNNGVLDIDYEYLQEGIQINDTTAYVVLREGFTVRPTWQEITAEQLNQAKPSPAPEPTPQPTNAEIQQQLNLVLQGLALLSVQ